jgi:succinyl-CoA synthetase beta subunit
VNVPEHLGKALLREGGIVTPQGEVARDPQSAARVAQTLGGRVVLKAQIPAGKRGKSGGIAFASTPDEARAKAGELLGAQVAGHRVETLLVESAADIESELYAAILNDGASRSPLVLFSTEGGVDIEELNQRAPEKIVRRALDVRTRLDAATAREIAGDEKIGELLRRMYDRFIALDCELLEINPLARTRTGELIALDCKMALDDSSRPRQKELFDRVDSALGPQGTALEQQARAAGLYFIELDGEVGVLANGAGLTMTTLDAINLHGGKPANFLEIGGENYTKATSGLEVVLSNPKVRSVLVNFCGAYARTDVMAEGVIAAYETLKPKVPFFFTIHGTGEERAIELVSRRLGIEPFAIMDDAVRAAVSAAREPLGATA